MSAKIASMMRTYGTVLAGILITIVFSVLRPNAFCTLTNFINITRQISLLVIIGIGATLVMTVDEFDLSIGSLASLSGIIAARLAVTGVPTPICFIIAISVCIVIGAIDGYIVTKFRVLSFVTTLAMGTVVSGITFWISGGATVFQNIPTSFKYIGATSVLRIPLMSVIMLVLVAVFTYIMKNMVFGRELYAIGGNTRAARLSGLNVDRDKNIAFVICAALSGLTGVMLASRLGSAHPTGGDGFFMDAYAAAFIGRTLGRTGAPSILGTLLGAAILGILANGLTIMQVPTYMQEILTGCIIIIAVVAQKLEMGEGSSI